jgi:hypothetical protein
MMNRGALVAILVGGLAAGIFDILYAMALTMSRGNSIMALLQFIASGLLGKSAFQAGLSAALLGLALHFLMALIIATIYVGACQLNVARRLRENPFLAGPLFGVAVCFVMREVVVPLSRSPIPPAGLGLSYAELLAMMFLVGLPIAIAEWKYDTAAAAPGRPIWR